MSTIVRQDWLAPVEGALGGAVARVFEALGPVGAPVRSFLHGRWLGHPLHAALTDVPIGAWTATLVLDMHDAILGRTGPTHADSALEVGLVGAAASALTGLTDWHVTDGEARRIGVVHGLMNTAVTAFYMSSWVSRRRGRRALGHGLAYAGFLVALGSAWLGGHLVYRMRVGVDGAGAEPSRPTLRVVPSTGATRVPTST